MRSPDEIRRACMELKATADKSQVIVSWAMWPSSVALIVSEDEWNAVLTQLHRFVFTAKSLTAPTRLCLCGIELIKRGE